MGGRTILEVTVPNQSVDQVRQFLNGWFPRQGFTIEEWQASGQPKVIWKKAVRVKITPVPGAIVASSIGMGGAIVFDVLLTQNGPNVLFHIQGYAATAGFTAGGEMSLEPNPGISGRIPRKKGYETMMRLFSDLGATCGVVLQPAPPGYSSPPMQQQQQHPQRPYPQQQPPPQQPQQQQQPPPQQPQQQQQGRPQSMGPQEPGHKEGAVDTDGSAYKPKFCIYCGKPLEANARFCGQCGKSQN
jgi:hypothetical protein